MLKPSLCDLPVLGLILIVLFSNGPVSMVVKGLGVLCFLIEGVRLVALHVHKYAP